MLTTSDDDDPTELDWPIGFANTPEMSLDELQWQGTTMEEQDEYKTLVGRRRQCQQAFQLQWLGQQQVGNGGLPKSDLHLGLALAYRES